MTNLILTAGAWLLLGLLLLGGLALLSAILAHLDDERDLRSVSDAFWLSGTGRREAERVDGAE